MFVGNTIDDLSNVYRDFERELRGVYLVGFYLDGGLDGKMHRLKIETKSRGVRLRAKRGYLAR